MTMIDDYNMDVFTNPDLWKEIYSANNQEKAKQLAKSLRICAEDLYISAQRNKVQQIKEILEIG